MAVKLTEETINALVAKAASKKSSGSVTIDDIESFGSVDSLRGMLDKIMAYNRMIKQRITFVNDALTKVIPFSRENLYLICAYTGSGKSTIAANISYPLWKQDKKTLVITNEESSEDVIFRIGCIELGYNFNDYKKGNMSAEMQANVFRLAPEITRHVKVLDVRYKEGLTTKLEGIKAALEQVRDRDDYSCVMIDYYQLIKYSTEDASKSSYDVLNDLRIYLGRYIKEAKMPVVLFAQLHSIGKRANKDLDSRVKDCPGVLEPATVVIEVIPNFKDKTSDFIIHKDRFGFAGQRITCGFDKGRFVLYSDEFKRKILDQQLQDLEIDSLPSGLVDDILDVDNKAK